MTNPQTTNEKLIFRYKLIIFIQSLAILCEALSVIILRARCHV